MRGSGSRLSVFRRLAAGLGLTLALTLAPGSIRGQMGGDCEVPRHNGFVTVSLSNGSRITYFSAPTIVCGGNTHISADSAVVYEATNYTQLFRHVVFEDGESRLTADQAHYFDQERRLRAWGQVVLRDLEEGSIIRGDTMVLLRAGPGRPEDELTVLGTRPRATLYPKRQPIPADSAGLEAGEGPGQVRPDTAATDLPDTVTVGRPDTARVSPPDTLVAVRADTSVAMPPDTSGAQPPDTARIMPRDTSAVRPPDTAMTGLLPDTAEVRLPDTVKVSPPDTAMALPPPASRSRSAPVPQEDRTPYEVQARRMFLEGSRYFRAVGAVTVTRDSVNAEADSLEYDETAGALFLDFETVFAEAGTADVWINPGAWTSLAEGRSEDRRFAQFRAFRNGMVFNYNARVSPGGGIDYFESGASNPHIVLKDLIWVFHPELLPDYQPYYYQRLK